MLNIHKTRLNDPFMWFMGTNDQPGDYRHSGCSGCHVIYANDREPRHSLTYSGYGRDGETDTVDPTIRERKWKPESDDHGGRGSEHGDPAKHAPDAEKHGGLIDPADAAAGPQVFAKKERFESGHPIKHTFTRSIPTSQCMTCHMHQPNIFLNSYLGYTMWDYESDAPQMWPGPHNTTPRPEGMSDEEYREKFKKQRYPTAKEVHKVLERNPEAAAPRGLWADVEFLRDVYDVNDTNKDTQFADYHGHGWNFRGIFKRDRNGNLLTADGNMATYGTDTAHIVDPADPEKWRKSCASYTDPKQRDLCLASADPGLAGVRGQVRAARPEPRQGGPHDGYPRRKGHAVRRLPLRAGQPRQRLYPGRGRECGRDRLQGLPRHRRRFAEPAHLQRRRKTAGHKSCAAAQPRRPPPFRIPV